MPPRTPKRSKEPAKAKKSARGGFTVEDVRELVDLLEKSDLTGIAWQRGSEKVVLRRGGGSFGPARVERILEPPVTAVVPTHAPAAAPAGPREPKKDLPGVLVSSPFVGTFYRSSSPDVPPFVDIGQKVKKGQTLCIIEAMKLMNEIESEVDGTVAEILVPNATAVEFGEALFRIVPG